LHLCLEKILVLVGVCLLWINFRVCRLILSCNLKVLRPTYRQSQQHTFWLRVKSFWLKLWCKS